MPWYSGRHADLPGGGRRIRQPRVLDEAHRVRPHVRTVATAMVIMALVGRLPRSLGWKSFGLDVLIFLMYFTANIRAIAPAVAGAHPVIAMVLL